MPEPGGIEKIELAELPFPDQKPNEVLVKVRAITALVIADTGYDVGIMVVLLGPICRS